MKLEQSLPDPKFVFGPFTKLFNYKKRDLILRPELTEKYIYYLIKGAAVTLIENDGEEHCLAYHTEQHYFSAYTSFLLQKPTPSYIKAIEDCQLAAIQYNDLQSAYELSKEHERNGRLISERLFIRSNQRNIDLLSLSAEERYLKFIKESPDGLQRIPLKYIASFLGMTPVSLSRIRKKIVS